MARNTSTLSVHTIIAIAGLFSIVLFSSVFLVREQWRTQAVELRTPWRDFLETIVSPSTADALQHDPQLRRSYLEVLELTAEVSRRLASQYELPGLEEASESLQNYKRQLLSRDDESQPDPKVSPRQLLGIPGIGGSPTSSPGTTPSSVPAANPLGDAASSLLGPITDAFSGIGSGILSDVAGAAMFLGIGVGAGTAQGLKLADAPKTEAVSKQVAADNGMNATGLNPAIMNLGTGLSGTLVGSINTSSLGGNIDIGGTVRGLAEGLGTGTVVGLNMSGTEGMGPPNATGIPEIAGNFGFGLSRSVVSNINVSGSGTGDMIMKYLPAAASGLGKGLGEGIPVGLGVAPDTPVELAPAPPGELDASGVAQGFAKGFTSRLLANGTVGKLMSGAGGAMGAGLPAIDFGTVAQGFARGMLQGAGDAVDSIGGVGALMNGTAHAPVGPPPNGTLVFNDTVGGAATGFGQGLGGQGVLVARQLLQGVTVVPPAASTPSKRDIEAGSLNRITTLVARQNPVVAFNGSIGLNLSVFVNAETISTAAQIGVNALTCQGVGGVINVLLGLVSSGTIPTDQISGGGQTSDMLKQAIPTGIIRITNQGHLYEVDGQQVAGGLDGGLVAAAAGVRINGHGVVAFAVFLVLHILLAIIAFLNMVPLAIGLESARNILVRAKLGHVLPKAPRWKNIIWYFVFSPLAILIFIFGVVVMGSSPHFRTPHGVLGLLTVLVGFLAVVLHYVVHGRTTSVSPTLRRLITGRTVVNQLLLVLSLATSMTGFADLTTISLCFTQIISLDMAVLTGFSLGTLFVLGSSIAGMDIYLGWRSGRKHKLTISAPIMEKPDISA